MKRGFSQLTRKTANGPPRLFLCVGLKSSGSTWLYNVAIQIAEESLRGMRTPRGALKAFYADDETLFPEKAERARYLVVKSHLPSAALLWLTRLMHGRILVTVREPRDAMASLLQRFRHPFESSLKDVAEQAAKIADLSRTHETLCLRYEDGFYDKNETIGEIARFMGIALSGAARRRIHGTLTRDAVRAKIETLQRKGTFGADPDAFDPKTHWHPGHVGDGRIGKYAAVLSPQQQKQIVDATKDYRRLFGYRTSPVSAKTKKSAAAAAYLRRKKPGGNR